MAVQAYVLVTTEQLAAAVLLNDDNQNVQGRLITNTLANNLGYGVLVGLYTIPASVVATPGYERWYPTLGTYDIHVMDDATLYPPDPPI